MQTPEITPRADGMHADPHMHDHISPPFSPHHSDEGMLSLPPPESTVPIAAEHAPEVSTLRRASAGVPGAISAVFEPASAGLPSTAPTRSALSRMSAAPAVYRTSPPVSEMRPAAAGAAAAARPRPSLSRASCPVNSQTMPPLPRPGSNGNTAQPRPGLGRPSLRRTSVIRAGVHCCSCMIPTLVRVQCQLELSRGHRNSWCNGTWCTISHTWFWRGS